MQTDEARFWNSSEMADYFGSKPPDPRIVEFLEQYPSDSNIVALDLGCGGGRHTNFLSEKGFTVAAVDVNPGMLEATSRRVEDRDPVVDVQYGSILNIPHEDGKFDVVVTTGVLHQAKTVDEYHRATAELARVLKPGGVVLLNIFTNAIWDDTYVVKSDDGYSVETKEGLSMTLLPKDVFVGMMELQGLHILNEHGEDIKEENTGPRAVYRAFFMKK